MLNSLNGKSQASLLILVMLVAIFVVAWIFALFLTSAHQERAIEKMKLSKLSKYLDFVKGFSRGALLLSAHTSLREVASFGGEISTTGLPRNWICNYDVSPTANEVRFFLSESTIEYLNDYLANFEIKDLPTLEIKNFTCIDYDVDEATILSDKFDERFNVGAYGSKVNISLEDDVISSANDIYEEIAQVRFWYMYRKFKEWASTTRLADYIAECFSLLCHPLCHPCDSFKGCDECGIRECVEDAINKAEEELTQNFDDFVKCSGTLSCCDVISNLCEPPGRCRKCCKCQITPAGKLCTEELLESLEFQSQPYSLSFSPHGTGCTYWKGNRLDVETTFSCKDNKYLLSVKGSRNLVFSVGATINLENSNDCPKSTECEEVDCGTYIGQACAEDFCWCSVDCEPQC
ncbi:MAG: hypothetical protein QMD14_04375 [Candidatus Aenigmarchaeota archaeon]|nr:hypothetical protein [Candidatus Aenigmarchaeota archaeon]